MKKGIAIYDLHYPYHNKNFWKNMMDFVDDFNPNVFLFGGDNLDMTPVSHWLHAGGQFRKLEGKRLLEDYEGFNKDILKDVYSATSKNVDKIWLYGNHEKWCEQAVDKNPQLEGMIEIEKHIDLSKWKTVDYGNIHTIKKLNFTHGMYTNQYHAAKTVMTVERNIVYGHNHTSQTFTKTTPINNESHMAIAVPCAAGLNPDYNKNMPNQWLNGFFIWYMEDNGNFNGYTVIATNGKFIVNGKRYGK